METKFKQWDEVEIAFHSVFHSFSKDEKVTILLVDPLSETLTYFVENRNGKGCWVAENHIK